VTTLYLDDPAHHRASLYLVDGELVQQQQLHVEHMPVEVRPVSANKEVHL
jgi:hypothetical protein